MRRPATSWALTLRILCAVALVFVGLAHRPAAALPGPVELAAYALPDGTFADICVNDAVHGKVKPAPGGHCEACRIGAAMLLPLPAQIAAVTPVAERVAARPRAGPALCAREDRPGASPRAPPVAAA